MTTNTLTLSKYGAEMSIEKVTLEKASVNLYSVAADLQTKEPALDEYEIVLSEKPKTNIFTLPFTSKDLVFYYQPPLTQELDPKEYDSITETEAWKDGKLLVSRPENIVGSYAVYHASKSGGIYGTGKAFHIYRPWAQDAKGWRVWCQLKIQDNTLIVVVPQDFLDKAVYPVVIDPTFGYESVGGSNGALYAYPAAGMHVGTIYLSAVSGTLTNISIYTNAASPWHVRVGLYSDEAGYPYDLLVESASTIGVAGGWCDIAFNYAFTGPVWLCLAHDVQGNMLKYDSSVATQGYAYAKAYGAFDAVFTAGATAFTNKFSIYATYTAASTGQPYISRVQFVEGMRTYGGF
jgi:hypothetical protein